MQTANGINSQLSITRADRQDSGVYKCVAENPFGKSEHTIYVAVQGKFLRLSSILSLCTRVCVFASVFRLVFHSLLFIYSLSF